MAHKKFGSLFVDGGGVQLLLSIPPMPYLAGVLGMCFHDLSAVPSVMEMICLVWIVMVEVFNIVLVAAPSAYLLSQVLLMDAPVSARFSTEKCCTLFQLSLFL